VDGSAHLDEPHGTEREVRDLYIDGSWRSAEDEADREVIDPFDASPIRTVAEASVVDARAAIDAARRAFDDGPWPRTSAAERGRLLWRVADLIERDREELAALGPRGTGKTLVESRVDVDDVAAVLRD
jgi:betaine-aldehyde dehydrogenase